MRRATSLLSALLVVTATATTITRPLMAEVQTGPSSLAVQSEEEQVIHSPPVDATIIDPFREPDHAYGAGNRGLEYDTVTGQPVLASADGMVSFAGQVGGNLFITIDHGAGLVTTVGLLEQILVSVGDEVEAGNIIASAGDVLHFSARRNGVYFDPQLLFRSWRVEVRLVAGP